MSETRKIAAILVTDVVGYSRLAGADEDRTLARLRSLRSDLIDPTISVHHGRIVKRTGDGSIIEFRSVVDAVRCAIEVQNGMVERNVGLPPERRIEFRAGIHLGDVVEESDGDLMGDGVNIAARLQGVAEPGGVCLSEDAYRHVRDKIKADFVDLGEKGLKNIARPIRVYAFGTGLDYSSSDQHASTPDKSRPPRLSIVVLPFANIGGDIEQDYFVDGITESLTTDLSRISGSFVIGRHTAFTYKGKAINLKQIGRELNVRYALEGSVQRGGNRMRVNVQLIDAESGVHLWAERFDKPLADLFDMQDEIISRLANALHAQLIAAEARRAERAPNPDSMDLYFQGLASSNTPGRLAQAQSLFERALTLDPGNIEALVGLAAVNHRFAASYWTDDRSARLAAAEAALAKALSSVPDHALAHMWMGAVQIYSNRAILGISECERALSIDRNLAAAHGFIGVAKLMIGLPEETEGHVRELMRLSPGDNRVFNFIHIVGAAKFHLGKVEESISWFRRTLETHRNNSITHFYLAAALALLGRSDEAQAAVQAGLSLNPAFTVARFCAGASSDNPTYLAQRERVCEGMLKAGVPEE
jgi:TolB-like protein/class 3 adenylate cyclase